MSDSKTVLIITDGTEPLDSIAKAIAGGLKGSQVKITSGGDFEGTDLLPADVFFLGSAAPSPSSFSYLEEMLAHINLAARRCAVFSQNKEAIKYLEGIVKNCEADLYKPLLAENNESVKNWLSEVKI